MTYNVRHFPMAIIFREKWKKYRRITTVLKSAFHTLLFCLCTVRVHWPTGGKGVVSIDIMRLLKAPNGQKDYDVQSDRKYFLASSFSGEKRRFIDDDCTINLCNLQYYNLNLLTDCTFIILNHWIIESPPPTLTPSFFLQCYLSQDV